MRSRSRESGTTNIKQYCSVQAIVLSLPHKERNSIITDSQAAFTLMANRKVKLRLGVLKSLVRYEIKKWKTEEPKQLTISYANVRLWTTEGSNIWTTKIKYRKIWQTFNTRPVQECWKRISLHSQRKRNKAAVLTGDLEEINNFVSCFFMCFYEMYP